MDTDNVTLYYIHDPMCSWCWGFRPVWQDLTQALANNITITYIVGGLAKDTDQPMPIAMQQTLANTWQRIQQQIPGIQFNYDFWHQASSTQPRRATYQACRAVLAAKAQGEQYETAMILAIQQTYYLQAKNPSNLDTLTSLAVDLGLHEPTFYKHITGQVVEAQLQQQIALARQLSNQGFPSLVLKVDGHLHPIPLDYQNSRSMHQHITNIVNRGGPVDP